MVPQVRGAISLPLCSLCLGFIFKFTFHVLSCLGHVVIGRFLTVPGLPGLWFVL